MQVKTFKGPDAKTVLASIKRELGPEAVILSKHEGSDEDGQWCEMTAGLERATTSGGAAGIAGSTLGGTGPGSAMAPTGWNEWHREWSEIREHLLTLMKPGIKLDELAPRQRVALEFLEREGMDGTTLLRLYRRLHGHPHMSVLAPLGDMLPVRPWDAEAWPQRVHAVAGPFGCGKTSTLIRMALALRARKPNTRIALINTDNERGNGRLLLKHYADLSGILYREAGDPLSFATVLRETREMDTVLVDLPGLSRNADFAELDNRLGLCAAQDMTVHMVLAPSYAPAQLAAFARQYAGPCTGSIIWTKLDEACTFGAVANIAASTGLPVSALSFGPGLKNTFVAARDVMLWRLLFKHQLPGEAQHGHGDAAM